MIGASTSILALDPGYTHSAWVFYDRRDERPIEWAKEPNAEVLDRLKPADGVELAIESIASYGMAVGAEVFETCVWVGRFIERWVMLGGNDPRRVYRREVKLHLCVSPRATDSNVRQAIIDRYGPGKEKAVGRKATPGPLYGIKADCWQALGVAITADETEIVVPREAA